MQDHFGRSEAAELLGITPARLRYWERINLIRPSLKDKRRSYYDFHDLLCLKTAQELIGKGLSPRQIRADIESLRERLNAFEGRLGSKRIYVFSNRILISDRRRLIATHTGDLLFKFDVNEFRRMLSDRSPRKESRSAEQWLEEGVSLEADGRNLERALDAYRQAVKRNPRLVEAYVRMGSLHYSQGKLIDAQRCFRNALRSNPYHAPACFRLANVLDDLNCTEESLRWYERAVEVEPEFSDAYFNLAAAAEKLGLLDRAVRAWRAYLRFEPTGPQASQVRRRIAELEQHLAAQT